jgi:hypothetical protein
LTRPFINLRRHSCHTLKQAQWALSVSYQFPRYLLKEF